MERLSRNNLATALVEVFNENWHVSDKTKITKHIGLTNGETCLLYIDKFINGGYVASAQWTIVVNYDDPLPLLSQVKLQLADFKTAYSKLENKEV